MRKAVLWFVVDSCDNRLVYTITSKKSECEEYIAKKVKNDYYPHYISWCELRGLEENSNSWIEYVKTRAQDINVNYVIISSFHTKKLHNLIQMF